MLLSFELNGSQKETKPIEIAVAPNCMDHGWSASPVDMGKEVVLFVSHTFTRKGLPKNEKSHFSI